MKPTKLLRLLEAVFFCFGWMAIFYAGADHPVPLGFVYLAALVLGLSLVQDQYLKFLIPRLGKKRMFLKNTLLFTLAGLLISSLCLLLRPHLYRGLWATAIWVAVVSAVSLCYGTGFFLLNRWLLGHCSQEAGE